MSHYVQETSSCVEHRLYLISQWGLVKWITLHTAACKCWWFQGEKLNKAEKKVSIFGTCWSDIWLVRARAQETHSGGGESKGNAGVYKQQEHLGRRRIHTGTRAVKQSGSRVDTAVYQHLLTFLLNSSFFFLLILFLSLLFSLNRYRNMGNLLKVLTCTDLEQEPNFFLDFESEFFWSNCSLSSDIDHMNILP